MPHTTRRPDLRGRERRRLAARARRSARLPAADRRAHPADAAHGRRRRSRTSTSSSSSSTAAAGSARATASSPGASSRSASRSMIVLNKIDRLKPAHVVTQMKAAATLGDFHALHPVSAKTRDGVDELRDDLVSLLPEGPASLPARAWRPTSRSTERIAEIVREKALQLTREEVPHALTVQIDEIEEGRVRAFVLVETESQKGILVGQARGDGPRDRHACAAGGRGARSAKGLPRARRQGAPEVAPRPEHAGAPRPVAAGFAPLGRDERASVRRWPRSCASARAASSGASARRAIPSRPGNSTRSVMFAWSSLSRTSHFSPAGITIRRAQLGVPRRARRRAALGLDISEKARTG